jgi:hypothetical protein
MLEMKKETIRVLSEWLSQFHSHGIYAAVEELKKLEPHFSVEKETLVAEDGTVIRLPLYTDKQLAKQIENRGLGGEVKKTDELMFGGYQMAESIAAQVLDFYSSKMGRGSRYRECVGALAKAAA